MHYQLTFNMLSDIIGFQFQKIKSARYFFGNYYPVGQLYGVSYPVAILLGKNNFPKGSMIQEAIMRG